MLKPGFWVLLIATVVASAWWWTQSPSGAKVDQATGSGSTRGNTAGALGMRDAMRINPRLGSFANAADKITPKPVSAVLQAFRDRKNYPALLDQLKAGEQTAESLWLQAKILNECTKRPSESPQPQKKDFKETTPEEDRRRFILRLPIDDPQRDKRIAAYDRSMVRPCGSLSEITKTREEIYDLFKQAAAAGDLRARAEMITQEKIKAYLDARGKDQVFPTFETSGSQLDTMKELLSSQDPDVVKIVGGQLGSWMDGGSLVLTNANVPVNPRALGNAWTMVACDLGAVCGSESPQLLNACAWSGECDVDNLVDYTYFYGASLYHAQLIDQYRQILLTMIRSGDFSQMRVVRGATNAPSTVLPPKS